MSNKDLMGIIDDTIAKAKNIMESTKDKDFAGKEIQKATISNMRIFVRKFNKEHGGCQPDNCNGCDMASMCIMDDMVNYISKGHVTYIQMGRLFIIKYGIRIYPMGFLESYSKEYLGGMEGLLKDVVMSLSNEIYNRNLLL